MRSIHGEQVNSAAEAAAAVAAGLESLEGRVYGLQTWVTEPMTTPVASSDDAARLAAADGRAGVMGETTRGNALQVRVHKKGMMNLILKFTHRMFLRRLSAHVAASPLPDGQSWPDQVE